jgi:hypothetical protein
VRQSSDFQSDRRSFSSHGWLPVAPSKERGGVIVVIIKALFRRSRVDEQFETPAGEMHLRPRGIELARFN